MESWPWYTRPEVEFQVRTFVTAICDHRSSEHSKGNKGVWPLQSPFWIFPLDMAWQKKVKKAVFGATSKSEYSFRGGSPHVHVVEQTKNVLLAADGMGGTVEESLKHAVHGLPRLPWPDGRQYVELPQDHPRRNLAEVRGTLTKWRQNFGMEGDVYGHMVFVFQCAEFLWGFKKSPVL